MSMVVVDHFDRLPDSMLLLILNKLSNVKALDRCSAERFASLLPQVDSVIVRVDCIISGDIDDPSIGSGTKPGGVLAHLANLLLGNILQPIQAIQQMIGLKRVILAEVSHHSPFEVLRSFKELSWLRIELASGKLDVDDDALLKWKAEFGSSLESCAIHGATSFCRWSGAGDDLPVDPAIEAERDPNCGPEDQGGILELFYTNGGLKLHVVWTITSLIAASARHYLLQQIMAEHPMLDSLVLTDVDRQGMLCMGKEQLAEFRCSMWKSGVLLLVEIVPSL